MNLNRQTGLAKRYTASCKQPKTEDTEKWNELISDYCKVQLITEKENVTKW